MNWLYYLSEANIYLCLFYAGYCLLLSKDTHYSLNRVYLLLSCVAAFIIPFLQLGFLNPVSEVTTVGSYTAASAQASDTIATTAPILTWQSALLYLYITGIVVAVILFGIKIYKLISLIKNNRAVQQNGYKVIYIDEANTAFSFFNYVFISNNINGADVITRHEVVHIRQGHSFDIIFTELVKIFNWFNPLVYLLQNSLKTLHEYIADEQTAPTQDDKLLYSTFLLNNAYGLQGMPFSNSFFNYKLLKNRITMLNQPRSGKLARLKHLMAIPLCGAMLCASTLSFSKNYGFVDLLPQRQAPITSDTTPVKGSKNMTAQKPIVTDIKLSNNDKGIKDTVYTMVELTPPRQFSNIPLKAPKPVKTKVRLLSPPGKTDKTPIAAQVISNFDELLEYTSKHVRFPVKARDNNTEGSVVIRFTIDENQLVTNLALVTGIGNGCDEEALRTVTSYKKEIASQPGTYALTVNFHISKDTDEEINAWINNPSVANKKVAKKFASQYLSAGETTIVTFMKR